MNISENECTNLKHLCQLFINCPLRMEQQQHIIKDGKIWCSEWESLELCKYIIYGKAYYYNDPLPNRLKNNKLFFGKEIIEKKAESLLTRFNTVTELIDFLKHNRKIFK